MMAAPLAVEARAGVAPLLGNCAALPTEVERLAFLYLHPAGHHRVRFLYDAGRLAKAYRVST